MGFFYINTSTIFYGHPFAIWGNPEMILDNPYNGKGLIEQPIILVNYGCFNLIIIN